MGWSWCLTAVHNNNSNNYTMLLPSCFLMLLVLLVLLVRLWCYLSHSDDALGISGLPIRSIGISDTQLAHCIGGIQLSNCK